VVAGQQRDWDELAAVDPLWAILSDPERRGGRWQLDEFFRTGEADVGRALTVADELGRPERRERALDFGCGVGRVTRALAARFGDALGVDVSSQMVEQARSLNADVPNASFLVNAAPDLAQLETASFDLVYSRIVLQHLRSADEARAYVTDFLRIASPDGLVVFQLPAEIPPRHRIHLRRRLWAALRAVRVGPERLHRLGLSPIRVIGLPQADVRRLVEERGGKVLRAEPDDAVGGLDSFQYYVSPANGPILDR
jgi:SAM-dependent methyltransferase